jgi:hypothetical protein
MKLRIALRAEGNFWNAYLALPDTMDGAQMIGSIALGSAKRNPKIKQRFIDLMQMVFKDALKTQTGVTAEEFTIERAPEHERAGNA